MQTSVMRRAAVRVRVVVIDERARSSRRADRRSRPDRARPATTCLPSASSTCSPPRPKVIGRWSGRAAKIAAGTLPARTVEVDRLDDEPREPARDEVPEVLDVPRGHVALRAAPRSWLVQHQREPAAMKAPSAPVQAMSQVNTPMRARADVQRPLRAFEIADQMLESVLVDVLQDGAVIELRRVAGEQAVARPAAGQQRRGRGQIVQAPPSYL